jgi:dihydrofolate synthase/folylpolyglutamate synthase
MNNATIAKRTSKGAIAPGAKQYSYNDLVNFLDNNWNTNITDTTLTTAKKLDKALGSLSQKVNSILICGSNGKSLTTDFAAKLLKEEGLRVGTMSSPHILTYSERISSNGKIISNKTFTEIGNKVLNAAATIDITPNSLDVLVMMAIEFFIEQKTDLAIFEYDETIIAHAATLCSPKIISITRAIDDNIDAQKTVNEELLQKMLISVTKETIVVSADQSKLNLQRMQEITESKGGTWAMPIRKLADLIYPFGQLHGRCAALAERTAYFYVNEFADSKKINLETSLLAKKKRQRGRPTLEAKRKQELNPHRTVEQFWYEQKESLTGKFQILDKEKPSILLDSADNVDALENLLLGVRLLHYQRPIKGIALMIGNNTNLHTQKFFKLLRYFFKKMNGQVVICPTPIEPGTSAIEKWDAPAITNEIKSMKIKAHLAKDFNHGFEYAKKLVDDRNGLVIITGSNEMVTHYWKNKGIKKI